MEKPYPRLFAGIKINIVLVSGELKTTIPPKQFSFQIYFPIHSRCLFLKKNHSKIISNTHHNKTDKNIQKRHTKT